MSGKDFTLDELSRYLQVPPAQIAKMVSRDEIQGRQVGGKWVFSRADVHHWFEDQLGRQGQAELRKTDRLLENHSDNVEPFQFERLFFPEAIAKPLLVRTRNSAVREMCQLAANTGMLWDVATMREAVEAREQLHTTALENGVALLHPRRPQSSILGQSLVAIGVSQQPIPFGNTQGHLTDIFFLICSMDDAVHLQILAKLSRLISEPQWLPGLRECETPQDVYSFVTHSQQTLPLLETH